MLRISLTPCWAYCLWHLGLACAPIHGEEAASPEPARASSVRSSEGTSNTTSETTTDSNSRTESIAAASAPARFVQLDLQDLPSAVFWQIDPPQPAPLIVSAHGAGGTPDWHCDWLSSVVGESAFVLCLRGKPMRRDVDAYYYPEHHTLGALFEAAVGRVEHEFAQQLDPTQRVYVAYSQGATMGALMMLERESPMPFLLLIEGGYDSWTAQRCERYARAGGEKVYFACGTQTCHTKAVGAAERLQRAGVQAQVGYAPHAGHTPAGEVGRAAEAGLVWLLDGGSEGSSP